MLRRICDLTASPGRCHAWTSLPFLIPSKDIHDVDLPSNYSVRLPLTLLCSISYSPTASLTPLFTAGGLPDLMTGFFRQGGSCLSCLTCYVESLFRTSGHLPRFQSTLRSRNPVVMHKRRQRGCLCPASAQLLSQDGAERLDFPALNPAPTLGQIVPAR